MDLARRLRHLRLRAGHTQRSLATALDVHYTAVSHIEKGSRTPSLALLEKWAAACNAGVVVTTSAEADLLDALLIDGSDPDILTRLGRLLPHLDPAHRLTLLALLDTWERAGTAGNERSPKQALIKIG